MIEAQALVDKFRQALSENWGYIWGTAGEKWTAAKQKELEKTTDSDRAQGREYGSKWIGHYVADCSGLFSWAFKKLGGYMYHGSDTMYRKYCTYKGELSKGKRTDGKELIPGTAVFVWNGKKYSHVGLFVGNGLVIEAMGTIKGVTTTKVTASKWTHWGELKDVAYSASEAPIPPPKDEADKTPVDNLPTLRKGNTGEYVTLLQTKLMQKGYDLGKYGIDGDFGSATLKAVKQFQADNGLTVDGVVGKNTWAALNAQGTNLLYTVTIPHLTKFKAESLVKDYAGAAMTEEGR